MAQILETKHNYRAENKEYIDLLENTILFFQRLVLPKLKNEHFTSLIKDKNVKIFLHDWKAQLAMAKSQYDQKIKVPVSTQHLLIHCIATMSSHNDASNEYFKQRMNNYSITRKQILRYKKSAIRGIPPLFKPQNRDQAMMWNYLGVKCQCKSWRVIEYDSFNFKSICLDCDVIKTYELPIKCNNCTILFYDEHILELKGVTKCPHCKEDFTPLTLTNIEAVLGVEQ